MNGAVKKYRDIDMVTLLPVRIFPAPGQLKLEQPNSIISLFPSWVGDHLVAMNLSPLSKIIV